MKHPMFPDSASALTVHDELATLIRTVPVIFRSGMLGVSSPGQLPAMARAMTRWWLTMAGQVERAVFRDGDATFLIDDYGSLTFRETAQAARRLAVGMRDVEGATRNSTVAYLARNGRGMVIPMTAQGYIGWRMALLNVSAGPASVARSLEKMGAEYLISDNEFIDALLQFHVHDHIRIIVNDPDLSEERRAELTQHGVGFMQDIMESARGREDDLPFHPKQSQIVIMSSGTTSDPKGIIIDQPHTPKVAGTIAEKIPWRQGLKIAFQASQFHAWGWANTMLAATTLSTIVTRRIFDPNQALDDAEANGCNAMVTSPVFVQHILDADEQRPRKLQPLEFLVSAGNAWPPQLIKRTIDRFGDVVINFYGSTEHTQISAARGVDMIGNPFLAGTLMGGTKVAILDEFHNEVPTGEIGIIYAMNSLAMRGFATNDGEIERAHGLLSTGDKGYLDEQGRLHVLGRGDSMIICGGENIHLKAVENCVFDMSGVADAYVGADRSDPLEVTPVAWVVRASSPEGAKLTEEDVQDYVRNNMIAPAAPTVVQIVPELERNLAGKVIPRKLPGYEQFQPAHRD